ncbi:glycosyltransferase family 2 protein [Candidatus Amesbacteria bacterium]|nr:glycosyltransferase family 2 protein [Candidatus Amesbacteria bacterium]
MIKIKLSVVLATYNEERNIARCLDAVKDFADEIIIVDGKSTDDTVKIAKKYKAKIILVDNNPTHFHAQKKLAIDSARGEWILQLDADECLTPELVNEIKDHLRGGRLDSAKVNGYWIPRKNYFLGRFLEKGGQYPDYTMRLYRNGKGNLEARDVHEQAIIEGEVRYLKNPMLHYGTPDFENYLVRNNKYTSLMAEQMQEQKEKLGLIPALHYLFLKPLSTFLMIYFRHRGYVDGFPGFVFALFSGLRFAIAYIKYWQVTKYPAHD